MALARPPVPLCGTFAALGPQLQALAEAADADMGRMANSEMFSALDKPFLILNKTSSEPVIAGFPAFPDLYDSIDFNTVEATNNGGITQLLSSSSVPPGLTLPVTSKQRWYYIGLYMQFPVSPVNTQWKCRLVVGNVNPITGVNNRTIVRHSTVTSPTNAATGNDYLWLDCIAPSFGGNVFPGIKHDAATDQSCNGGRFWAIEMATRR